MIASVHVLQFASAQRALRRRFADRRAFERTAGLRFGRLMASPGARRDCGLGNTLPPDLAKLVAIAAWEDEERLRRFLASDLHRRWRAEAAYAWHVRLEPIRSIGSMRGSTPFAFAGVTEGEGAGQRDAPVAILTFTRVPLRKLHAFTNQEMPRATRSVFAAPGLIVALGAGAAAIGGVTFSLWESLEHARRYAYGDEPGVHRRTVERDRRERLTSEAMFVRLRPTAIEGTWNPRTTRYADRLEHLASSLCGRLTSHSSAPAAEQ